MDPTLYVSNRVRVAQEDDWVRNAVFIELSDADRGITMVELPQYHVSDMPPAYKEQDDQPEVRFERGDTVVISSIETNAMEADDQIPTQSSTERNNN